MKHRLLILSVALLILCSCGSRPAKEQVVTTFYPLYVATLNVVKGTDTPVVNLTQNHVGCIHDYTLTTYDMKILESASLVIINGSGLESAFISKLPKDKLLDSSAQIDVIADNPHVWMSVSNMWLQTDAIARRLSELYPQNADIYMQNALNYREELLSIQTSAPSAKSAVCLNSAFEYMAADIGFKVICAENGDEHSTLSAAQLAHLVEQMRSDNIDIILTDTESDYANTLARETGAKILILDTITNGDDNLSSYINRMRENYEKLANE